MTDYDFHTLSPMDFELLTCQLLREKLGLDLKAFGHGPDGGVDLRHTADGTTTVVQCKHYRGSSFSDLKRAAKREKQKVDEIKPDRYYFVTSQDLSLTQHETLKSTLSPWLVDDSQIIAQKDLNQLLAEYPQVEQRNFKLWMASSDVIRRIVHSGLWERSSALLEEIQERVRLYVWTPHFEKAAGLLNSRSVCVVTGAPGVGKSMLADMLALTHWDSGWQVVTLASHELDKCWDAWNSEVKQLFHFDDVFGQTDVQERLRNDSGSTLARLIRRVSATSGKRIVITTRTHVLREAEGRDEPLERARLELHECIVQVADYDKLHRARILYNHLYFSNLDRQELRGFVSRQAHWQVIRHPNFTTRIIEQVLIQHYFSDGSLTLESRLLRALDRPVALWGPSFEEVLSDSARWNLLHLVSFPTVGAPVNDLRAVAMRSASPIEYRRGIKQLEGSWIKISPMRSGLGGLVVTFHDPSCRDFVLSFLESEPDYVVDLLGYATDAVQVTQLLRYGLASGRDSALKYPNIRGVLESRSRDLAETIITLWDQRTDLQDWLATETLALIAELDEAYELDLSAWIVQEAFVIGTRLDRFPADDSSSCAQLAAISANSGRRPSQAAEFSSLSQLLRGWCAPTLEAGDWLDICEFRDWLTDSGNYAEAEGDHELLWTTFAEWLDAELEAVMDNADDSESARSWAGEISDTAKQCFPADAFASRFISFEEGVHEKWENYEPDLGDIEYMRWASAVQESGSSRVSLAELIGNNRNESLFRVDLSDDGQIRSMYRHLDSD